MISSPHCALIHWVHLASERTLEILGKLAVVAERPVDAVPRRRVVVREDEVSQLLRGILGAPRLTEEDPEELARRERALTGKSRVLRPLVLANCKLGNAMRRFTNMPCEEYRLYRML